MPYGCICWVGTKDLEKQMLMQSKGGLFDLKALFHFSDALFLLCCLASSLVHYCRWLQGHWQMEARCFLAAPHSSRSCGLMQLES